MTRHRRRCLDVLALAVTFVIASSGSLAPAPHSVAPAPAPWEPELPYVASPPRAQFGVASWYGEWHHGRETATGEPFDQWALTAAHPTLPLGSYIEVTNVANGRRVRVRVNDRGPVVNGRILDLSRAAAQRIGPLGAGVYYVRIRVLDSDAIAVASDAQPAEHVRRAAAHDPQPSAVRRASLRGR